ncbi:hypothetical protein [Gordonia sp. NB41Y]|uniref:hypothetical protein n=1 Tax=Gordonia sp. NB41Y TaxID=875808 RepID=UPI0006B18DA5|nr:hypothetical protein [Gordonia sp. NB41Y]WLP92150.1 hypothetical protein Q9K23_07945 [Gordonia sp. NB41Y]
MGGEPVVRRPGRRFLPPAPPEQQSTPVVSRDFTRTRRSTNADAQKLSRKRKIAGDLPAWDPMPPGETLVSRPVRS